MKYIRFIFFLISSLIYNLRYTLSRKYYRDEVSLSQIPKWRYMKLDIFKSSHRYNWERLTQSIKNFGYKYKPIVLYSIGINSENGKQEYLIKDGNHRFTVLSELYGSDYTISVYIKYKNVHDTNLYDFKNKIKNYQEECVREMTQNHKKLMRETKNKNK